ncbi:MAG TPA: YciI family protein [Polyangiaceae bacterium]|nr:YciI family protein [Polyangiaceae bacterium]
MKAIVIGVGAGATLEAILAVYPRHKAVVDEFVTRGDVIGIGPFADRGGSLAIFRSREAAEAFVARDPFILEGLIQSFEIREWADELLT